MTSFRIRPKFSVVVDRPVDDVVAGIKEGLEKDGHPFALVEIPEHLILKIKNEDQHYWSPQLNLRFETQGEHTLVKGRYEPHHNVWTLFVLCYLALGVIALFLGIIGFSRLSLGLESPVLWGLPIVILFAFGLYFVSQLGQKLGAEETFDLHHFTEKHLGKSIRIQ